MKFLIILLFLTSTADAAVKKQHFFNNCKIKRIMVNNSIKKMSELKINYIASRFHSRYVPPLKPELIFLAQKQSITPIEKKE